MFRPSYHAVEKYSAMPERNSPDWHKMPLWIVRGHGESTMIRAPDADTAAYAFCIRHKKYPESVE